MKAPRDYQSGREVVDIIRNIEENTEIPILLLLWSSTWKEIWDKGDAAIQHVQNLSPSVMFYLVFNEYLHIVYDRKNVRF